MLHVRGPKSAPGELALEAQIVLMQTCNLHWFMPFRYLRQSWRTMLKGLVTQQLSIVGDVLKKPLCRWTPSPWWTCHVHLCPCRGSNVLHAFTNIPKCNAALICKAMDWQMSNFSVPRTENQHVTAPSAVTMSPDSHMNRPSSTSYSQRTKQLVSEVTFPFTSLFLNEGKNNTVMPLSGNGNNALNVWEQCT